MTEIFGGIDYSKLSLIPIAKADLFNVALPVAEANWLGADITPSNSPSYIRIYVCVDVAGVLRIARTRDATTLTEDLNGGAPLVANAAYIFDVLWRSGDSINLRYGADAPMVGLSIGTIKRLIMNEIGGEL